MVAMVLHPQVIYISFFFSNIYKDNYDSLSTDEQVYLG